MHQHGNDQQGALQMALANFEAAHKVYEAKITTLKHESIKDLERYLSDTSRRDIEIQRAAAECMTLIGGQDFLDSHFLTTALTLRFALQGFDLVRLTQRSGEGLEPVDAKSAQAALEIAVHGLNVLSHMYNFRVIVLENFCGKLSTSTMLTIFKALGAELRNRGLEEVIKALVASAIPAFDTIERARQEANNALYEMAMDVKPGAGPTSIQITVKNELGQIVARRTARFESEDIEP